MENEIMELAKKLGEAIKNDERMIKFNEIKKNYEEDKEISRLTTEYNVHQAALREEYNKPEKDKDTIDTIQKRIDQIYNDITQNKNFIAFNQAQDEINHFMTEVNEEITFGITGERPCTHDCSSCGGCHH